MNLGGVSLEEGEFAGAALSYREGLSIAAEVGNALWAAYALDGLAAVALEAGMGARAARLAGASEALLEVAGASLEPSGQSLHGLQTWVALPKDFEDTDPAFHHHPADTLPRQESVGALQRVVAGRALGEESPVQVFTDTLYVAIDLSPGAEIELDASHPERALYVLEGESQLDYLMMYRADGTAAFVGLERVTGKLAGRTGTFVLRRTGVFERGQAMETYTVVEDSGTGGLRALRGGGSSSVGHGMEHPCTLDYEFAE